MKYNGIIVSDEMGSIINPVWTTTGHNGELIVGMILKMLEKESDLFLKSTEKGFHVCLKLNGKVVKLVQVWGMLEQETSDLIETRRQWLSEFVELDRDDDIQIARLFKDFKPTGGNFQNYSFHFGDERKIEFNEAMSEKIENAITGLASFVKNKVNEETTGDMLQ